MRRGLWLSTLCMLVLGVARAQEDTLVLPQPNVALIGKAFPDSVLLRWAPTNFAAWELGNAYGYRLERIAVEVEGELVENPTVEQVEGEVFKPAPLNDWEAVVQTSGQAAIAAQALYGDGFQLDFDEEQMGAYQAYQLTQQNELRFSFHLSAADFNRDVARLSGLGYVDRQVDLDTRYLYRLIPQWPDSLARVDTALLLTGPEDYAPWPEIEQVNVEEIQGVVFFSWETITLQNTYQAYRLERSQDTLSWEIVNKNPLVSTLNENANPGSRIQSATDSVGETPEKRYYRVRGLTPYGIWGPPSPVLSIQTGKALKTRVPKINAISPDNLTVNVSWSYEQPQENVTAVLERASTRQGPYRPISDTLGIAVTTFVDREPSASNYYRLTLSNPFGERWKATPALAQLIDSVPPAAPIGLVGNVSPEGIVTLDWTPNPDADVKGYRVFRANYLSEEFFQVTSEATPESGFVDEISVNTLTEQIHYQVAAVDHRGNQSALSAVLSLKRPDTLPPVPPQIHEYRADASGIALAWFPSPSTDVTRLVMYRRAANAPGWRAVEAFAPTDTAWTDSLVEPDMTYRYALVALDDDRNQSERGTYVQIKARPAPPAEAPKLFVEVDREGRRVRLGWALPTSGLQEIHVFRAEGDQPMVQITTLSGSRAGYTDRRVSPNSNYTYAIQWVLPDGSKSQFSTLQQVTY